MKPSGMNIAALAMSVAAVAASGPRASLPEQTLASQSPRRFSGSCRNAGNNKPAIDRKRRDRRNRIAKASRRRNRR